MLKNNHPINTHLSTMYQPKSREEYIAKCRYYKGEPMDEKAMGEDALSDFEKNLGKKSTIQQMEYTT